MSDLYFSEETCEEIEREISRDFEEALRSINFRQYNPESVEFKRALTLGQMKHILLKCNPYKNYNSYYERGYNSNSNGGYYGNSNSGARRSTSFRTNTGNDEKFYNLLQELSNYMNRN